MNYKYAYHIKRGYGYEDIWVMYGITDPTERERIKRVVLNDKAKRIQQTNQVASIRSLPRPVREMQPGILRE